MTAEETRQRPAGSTDEDTLAHPRPAAPAKPPSGLAMRLGTIGQIFRMTRSGKRWWLTPMMVVLVVLGLVLSGLQAIEYVAPFIYAIF